MKLHIVSIGRSYSMTQILYILCVILLPHILTTTVRAESQCETDTAALIAENPELQTTPLSPDALVEQFSDWKNCLDWNPPAKLTCEVDVSQNVTDYNATCSEAGGNYDVYRIDVQCESSSAVGSAVNAKVVYSLINIQQCLAPSCTETEIEATLQTVSDQVSQGVEEAGFGEGCTTNITTVSAGFYKGKGFVSTILWTLGIYVMAL